MFATQAAVFCVLAAFAAPHGEALVRPWLSLPWLALMGLLALACTVGAYLLMNTWQPKITATEAGLIYCVEPIFASLLALFLPGWFSGWVGIDYANEQVSWTLFVGGGLITLANVLLHVWPRPRAT